MMRYLFGNWKMNLARAQAAALAQALRGLSEGHRSDLKAALSPLKAAVFPPTCWLETVAATLMGSATEFGGQHCHSEASGMFTGETSAMMIKELGAKWCLVGHSERRRTFGESNDDCAARCSGAVKAGLNPVICVGESKLELSEGRTVAIVLEQLEPCLDALRSASAAGAPITPLIAYEPVWSIGSGKLPTTEEIAQITSTIRGFTGGTIPVLYGGSVTPDNARELASIPGVSGFLVGGASLDADKFKRIAAALVG